jgi:hypothetical protein
MDVTGSKLVVFDVWYHGKQFVDAVRAVSCGKSQSGQEDDQYLTLPARIVEHAFPAEAQRFIEQCDEVTYFRT